MMTQFRYFLSFKILILNGGTPLGTLVRDIRKQFFAHERKYLYHKIFLFKKKIRLRLQI